MSALTQADLLLVIPAFVYLLAFVQLWKFRASLRCLCFRLKSFVNKVLFINVHYKWYIVRSITAKCVVWASHTKTSYINVQSYVTRVDKCISVWEVEQRPGLGWSLNPLRACSDTPINHVGRRPAAKITRGYFISSRVNVTIHRLVPVFAGRRY